MDYEEILDFLYRTLPMFHRSGKSAFKPGLANIQALCSSLGEPQNAYPSIHIAGTNGKGSTSHLIASALQSCGYKTGLYTSPHLIDLRERVRINGRPISKSLVELFFSEIRPRLPEIEASYFELTVALAFWSFRHENVDVAVVETGLGGRLDSTNILTPALSVITNIGFDHMDILGHTLDKIAFEKAGIIKEGVPVLIGLRQQETAGVFRDQAARKKASLFFAEDLLQLKRLSQNAETQSFRVIDKESKGSFVLTTDLLGDFQKENVRTALSGVRLLQDAGWNLPDECVLEGFRRVKKQTQLRGRWDWVRRRPNIILDVAHNEAGLAYLDENMKNAALPGVGKLLIVLGFVRDKDVNAAMRKLPRNAVYFLTEAQVPRALPTEEMERLAIEQHWDYQSFATVKQAVETALEKTTANDTLLITGSFFIVGEALAFLQAQEWTDEESDGINFHG